jgi:ATP-binding cassette subfamily B protein RaxB
MSLVDVGDSFTGVAVELQPTANLAALPPKEALRLSDLCGQTKGLTATLTQLFAAVISAQAFLVIAPLFLKLVVDQGLAASTSQLLLKICVAFSLLVAFQAAAGWLRGALITFLNVSLGRQMTLNLFRHLLRLPLEFFHKRTVGTVVTRFGAVMRLRDLISHDLVSTLVDGVMLVTTVVVLLSCEALLGVIVLGGVGSCATLYVGVSRRLQFLSDEVIQAEARERTAFLETVRGIQAVKAFGVEALRLATWRDHVIAMTNREYQRERIRVRVAAARELINGLTSVLVIYRGGLLVMDGTLSLGTLFAFIAYQQQFMQKANALMDRIYDFKLMRAYLDRTADIALEPARLQHCAVTQPPQVARSSSLGHDVELANVSFRYSPYEPEILTNVSFHIYAGEHVAIVGPSGGGKSTLVKIILGLYEPCQGQVLIDGKRVHEIGGQEFRALIAVVMQDDQLFLGSIADNISFFDEQLDMQRVEEAARMAQIHADISRMPMKYESLIGDMGSVLSGGQRQRVLLARALYRYPGILILDEGTANLDPETETAVVRSIANYPVTRISITHRAEPVAAADRILELRGGTVTELSAAQQALATKSIVRSGHPQSTRGNAPRAGQS